MAGAEGGRFSFFRVAPLPRDATSGLPEGEGEVGRERGELRPIGVAVVLRGLRGVERVVG